jgi:5-methylcytosine-specific restriction endonuclease McrA
MDSTDYQLNIAVTEHFTNLCLADEYCETAPVDTLIRLIWRATGEYPEGDKQAYIRSYAEREGIKPKPLPQWVNYSFAPKKKREHGFQVKWKVFREQILRERGEVCEDCGADGVMIDRHMHVDHIIPRAEAPELMFEPLNVRVLCPSCHSSKTAQDVKARRGKTATQATAARLNA